MMQAHGDGIYGYCVRTLRDATLAADVLQQVFEQAYRATTGRSVAEHQAHLGRLMAGFSEAAQANPYAWDRAPHSADEIATPTRANRYVGSPYTKLMVSNEQVDMAAAMLVTTVLTYFVIRHRWKYPIALCLAATGFFVLVDATLLAAALHKIFEGGMFPLLLGAAIFAVMMTWRRGRERLLERLRSATPPLAGFLAALRVAPPDAVPGTAVFLTSTPDVTPSALLHSLKHYRVLHARNVFLTVEFLEHPNVPESERVQCTEISPGYWQVTVRYGYMDQPDVVRALELCAPAGLAVYPMELSYFLAREKLVTIATGLRGPDWQDTLFAAMARNAASVTDFFNIPPNRVVELGSRIEL